MKTRWLRDAGGHGGSASKFERGAGTWSGGRFDPFVSRTRAIVMTRTSSGQQSREARGSNFDGPFRALHPSSSYHLSSPRLLELCSLPALWCYRHLSKV